MLLEILVQLQSKWMMLQGSAFMLTNPVSTQHMANALGMSVYYDGPFSVPQMLT